MKKSLIVASIVTGFLVSPLLTTVYPTIASAEEVVSTKTGLTFLDRVTVTPTAPKQSTLGQDTVIDYIIKWKTPAAVNVLQTIIKINGNAEFVSIGDKVSDHAVRSDGTISYINDELQNYTSFPLVLNVTGEGVITVDIEIIYTDGVGEESQTTSVALNVVNDDRSLDQSKIESLAEINKLENLSSDEKLGYIKSVQGSTTVEEVSTHTAAAKEKDRQNFLDKLNKAKEEARTTINELNNLTEQQRDNFLGLVELASTIPEINGIVTDALKVNGGTTGSTVDSSTSTPESTSTTESTSKSVGGTGTEKKPGSFEGTERAGVNKGSKTNASWLPKTGAVATGFFSLVGAGILGALGWFRFKK